jgi:hypothetical protein
MSNAYVPETPQECRQRHLAQIKSFLSSNPAGKYDDFCLVNPCLTPSRFQALAAEVRSELAMEAIRAFVKEERIICKPDLYWLWRCFKLWRRSAERPGPHLGHTRFMRLFYRCYPTGRIGACSHTAGEHINDN